MSVGNNTIIYEVEGADPVTDRVVTAGSGTRTVVAAADPSAIGTAAIVAVAEGADQIELCGGLGLVWHAKVVEAVGDSVPVGAVMYGFESLDGVADYKARFGNEFLHEAFLYVQPGSDPAVDRTVIDREHARSILVAVPDVAAAPPVARALVEDDGVRLIELYGGFGPQAAADVLAATGTSVPVGISNFPR